MANSFFLGGRCWRIFVVSGRLAVLLVLLVSPIACINTPLPDYYVITPEARVNVQTFANLSPVAIGLGPITVPETLNRPNIVTPKDDNQLLVAEYHRWSEPLRDNLSRVIMTNLVDRLSLDKLYAYPWLGNKVDYQVRLDVLQMLGGLRSEVFVQVRWQVLTGDKPAKLLDTRISNYRVKVGGRGYSPMVGAYSQAVAQLSDDIAAWLVKHTNAQVQEIPRPSTGGEFVRVPLN